MRKLDREYLIKLKEENKKVYASELILEKRGNKFFSYSTNIEVKPLEDNIEFYNIILSDSSNYYFIGKESKTKIENIKVEIEDQEIKLPLREYA